MPLFAQIDRRIQRRRPNGEFGSEAILVGLVVTVLVVLALEPVSFLSDAIAAPLSKVAWLW